MADLIKELPEFTASDVLQKKIENKTGVRPGEPSVLEDFFSIIFLSPVKFIGVFSMTAIVFISVLLFRTNFYEPDTKTNDYYSKAEISTANNKAREALSLLGKFLNKTQVQLESEILGDKVSRPLNKSINTVTQIFKKGDENENN